MSETPGTKQPGLPSVALFDHALRLHRQAPDKPLARGGEPFPDDALHDHRSRPEPPEDRDLEGREAASVLAAYFARPSAHPSELADAFHDIHVPLGPNEHVTAVAELAGRDRVRRTGRWLVRHGSDQCAVTVGLALIAAVGTVEDIPSIQTIGLLSRHFGHLAAHALERLPGGTGALLWLADRVTGWGRVYVVEALCRMDDPVARPWLLRRACDGDFLNAYFAGKVATVAQLHEALGELDIDSEMADHVGRLLVSMSDCAGMGLTLARYPHAGKVLEAHARSVGALGPTIERYFTVALLAQHLTAEPPEAAGCTAEQQAALRTSYISVLDRGEWTQVAVAGLAAEDNRMRWLANHRAPQLRLRAFPDRLPRLEDQRK
ncbi:hypothetical protein GCM10010145_68060 [Streptomyces ruber]|uniref:Uncharacterized protein n=2 Tax=Streptomyces TaxID=1883 RepID=A0A918BS46_9ACTN|nr:hypothetical protein [Streptomyces ruber]GGQ88933.1 hypothetical protein GCM10010145_68060 [Streptomyces ruber]